MSEYSARLLCTFSLRQKTVRLLYDLRWYLVALWRENSLWRAGGRWVWGGGGGVPNETDWNEMCLRPCTFRGKKLSGPKRHIVYIHHGQQRLFLVTQWSCAAANNKVLFFISVFESFLTNSTFTKRNTKKYGNMIFEFNQNFSFLIFCNISENSPPHVYLEFFGFFVCTATERCQWRQNGCSG